MRWSNKFMDDYYIEIDFDYPKKELLEYQLTINEWAPNLHYNKKGINTIEDVKWFDHYPDFNSNLIFYELLSNIHLDIDTNVNPFKFVKTLKGGSLPYHIDPIRECVLMLPLTDDNADLFWINNKSEVICKCTYKGPTVINAKIMHGVPENKSDRIFLQVNIPCDWKYLINNYKDIFT